jgi:FAD synthase
MENKKYKNLVHEFIRNEKKFANVESLQRAIRKDIAFASDKKVCKLT